MSTDKQFRHELIGYLQKPHTHASLTDTLKGFPENLMNERPDGVPYSFWELLEHIRISQFDMLDFIRNSNYKEMDWPKDYWPGNGIKATKKMWDESIEQFEKDLNSLEDIINNPEFDLLVPIKHGTGQTILREVLQIIDHNSYHVGQLVTMRRAVGAWSK